MRLDGPSKGHVFPLNHRGSWGLEGPGLSLTQTFFHTLTHTVSTQLPDRLTSRLLGHFEPVSKGNYKY